MGCYDTVMVPCPKCGKRAEFQSKSGPCTLDVFKLEEAPDNVLMDVNRHAPYKCDRCSTSFGVKLNMTGIPAVWYDGDDDGED